MSIKLACEAAREESRDEQRNIAETLQAALPGARARRLERIGQHVCQRLDAQAIRGPLIQRIGARKHGEQIDDILFGLLVDVQMLVFARTVKRITKEFAQRTYRNQRSRRRRLHMASFSD